MSNDFLQGVQGAQAAFQPLIASQVNAQDMQQKHDALKLRIMEQADTSRHRRAIEDNAARQADAMAEHYRRSGDRQDRLDDDTLAENEVSRAVRKFKLEQASLDRQQYLDGLKDITAARKELLELQTRPASEEIIPSIRDVITRYSHLGTNSNPQIVEMAKALSGDAMRLLANNLSVSQMNKLVGDGFLAPGETDPDRVKGARLQSDVSESRSYAAQHGVDFDKLDHSALDYERLKNGQLKPETRAALKGQVDIAVKKRLMEEAAQKPGRVSITRDDEQTGERITLHMTPEQAREQGFSLSPSEPPLDTETANKVEALEGILRRLIEAKARKVSKVDRGEILAEKPTLDTRPWFGGMPIDEAISTVHERINALRGKPNLAEGFLTRGKAGTPPPAEGSRTLSIEEAKQLLRETGGDEERARQLAKQRGFSF